MSQPARPANSPSAQIELEALGRDVVIPHDRAVSPNWALRLNDDDGRSIPDRSGYNCPCCDYDLRTMTGRVCPECGSTFTIGEARRAGIAHDLSASEDMQAIRIQRIARVICVAMFVTCFFAPFIATASMPTIATMIIQSILTAPFVFGFLGDNDLFEQFSIVRVLVTTSAYVVFCIIEVLFLI